MKSVATFERVALLTSILNTMLLLDGLQTLQTLFKQCLFENCGLFFLLDQFSLIHRLKLFGLGVIFHLEFALDLAR